MSAVPNGSVVRFRLGDVFCPDEDEAVLRLLLQILKMEWRGRVVFSGEAAPGSGVFASVEVEGMDGRVIIAADRLTRLAARQGRAAEDHAALGPVGVIEDKVGRGVG